MKNQLLSLPLAMLFSISVAQASGGNGFFEPKKHGKGPGDPTAKAAFSPPAPTWITSPLPQDVTVSCAAALPVVPTLIATDACPMGATPVIFINEFHYDNVGVDVNEFVEIAGTAGINLANYSILLYNGADGKVYDTKVLTGLIDNEGAGFGAVAFSYPSNGIQNGAPDAIALVRTLPTVQVLQFLSYEGGFSAVDGPAMGLMSQNIGVLEVGTEAAGMSLQLKGTAMDYAGFAWAAPSAASAGTLNVGQTLTALAGQVTAVFSQTQMMGACSGETIIKRVWTATDGCAPAGQIMHMQTITVRDLVAPVFAPVLPPNLTLDCSAAVPAAATLVATDACDPNSGSPLVWINEFHYDNAGADVGEFIEIAGTAGTDLAAFQMVLYNGADNFSYNVMTLAGVIPNQSNGFGAVAFPYPTNGIQNGSPDAIALAKGTMLLQFLSYEGPMTAGNGVANAMPSQNLPVSETGLEPIGQSLQLVGTGSMYSNFVWSGPTAQSPGALNAGQTIPTGVAVGLAVSFSTSTLQSPNCPFGRTITRTWSAMDACSNMAKHTQTITIEDKIAPTITALATFTVNLDINGLATVTLADLGATASDNCSATANVTILPAAKAFSCDDLLADRFFNITATDQCGNAAQKAVTIVFVQNPAAPAMFCEDLVEVSLNQLCLATVSPDMILEGNPACLSNYSILLKNTLTGVAIPNPLTAAQIGQPITVTVKHGPSGNSCWGFLTVEDKLAPTISCGGPFLRTCLEAASIDDPASPAFVPKPVGTDNCSAVEVLFLGEKSVDDPAVCSQRIITRTFIAKDARGLVSAPCEQKITIAPSAAMPVFPLDRQISCAAFAANPALIEPNATGGAGFPTGANVGGCAWATSWTDQYLELCGGEGTAATFKILRTWLLQNVCTGQNASQLQVITVMDNAGPTVVFGAGFPKSYFSDGGKCRSTAFIPMPTLTDCSSIRGATAILSSPAAGQTMLDTVAGGFRIPVPGLMPDAYTFIFKVFDACGNATTSTTAINIIDAQLPTPICQEITQVSVGSNGQIFVPAAAFNSGSYDNCYNPVFLKARRGTSGSLSDEVTFSCSQIGTSQVVTLKIYEKNPGNGSVSETADGGGLTYECMVTVLVEDKLHPECFAPPNVTTTCDVFRDKLDYGVFKYQDNCAVTKRDSSITFDAPGSGTQAEEQKAFEACRFGRITKRWTVMDAAGLSSFCEQTINVNYKEQYRVEWPNDKTLTTCNAATDTLGPRIFSENCELIGVSFDDQLFTVVPDACYKIIRTWRVINWCTYNPNLPEILVTKQNSNAPNGPITWIGAGWSHATAVGSQWPAPSIGPGSPLIVAPPNGTISLSALNGAPGTPAYRYMQIIKVQDQQDPLIGDMEKSFCDYSKNVATLWNSPVFWDPKAQSHDLCEGPTKLCVEVGDACSGNDVNARYLLFLDLDGNGTMETTINSNAAAMRFGIKTDSIANGKRFACVTRDPENDAAFPQPSDRFYSTVELPLGKHKIKWILEDNCGNDAVREFEITVADCKKPTIICKPLAAPLMNGPAMNVTIWATDFVEYAEDNCRLDEGWFSIRKQGATGFGSGQPPLGPNGSAIASATFSCADPTTSQVEIWTRDLAGNYDFCVVYLLLNKANCLSPISASISGALATDAAAGLAEAKVQIAGSAPGIPSPTIFTGDDGFFSFAGLPLGADFTVTPTKDVNPTNGVSTYDLVLISKHILGAEPFSTPFKFIAADVNKSGAVSTADIVELRKLILGIVSDFPNNESWRFVARDYGFTSSNPAGEAFPESATVAQLAGFSTSKDFVAVKIGDVNGSAAANNLAEAADRSPVGFLAFEFEDKKVEKGQLLEVDFTAKDLAEVAGFQFALEAFGAEIVDVLPKNGMNRTQFALFSNEKLLTASWNGAEKAVAFALVLRAEKAGFLSDLFKITPSKTPAEAYKLGGEPLDVVFKCTDCRPLGGDRPAENLAFELFQNEPNPFADRTTIAFSLPESGEAKLQIFAADGRLVLEQKGVFKKGRSSFLIEKSQLGGASGALLARLTTAKNSAARAMIVGF